MSESPFADLLGDYPRANVHDSLNEDERAALGRFLGAFPGPVGDFAPYSLSELLTRMERFVRRFVVFPSSHEPVIIALWVAHAHAIGAADVTPYLIITSATMRAGKTRLMEVLELLVRALRVSSISEAALFRTLDDVPGIVPLIDEADAIFSARGEREDLRSLINAGYRRGAVVVRCEKQGNAIRRREFSAFGAKAIAAIGSLPETISDRGVPIRLRRRALHEPVERFRFREAKAEAEPLCGGIALWAEGAVPALRDARPAVPDKLNDRMADGLEPLFAIADLAGDEWPTRARAAALALAVGSETDDEDTGVLLLRHVREAFSDDDRIKTADLLAALIERDDGPWARWWAADVEAGRTKGPASRLARLLRAFGIRSKKLRVGGGSPVQGYEAGDFTDAWNRYQPVEQHSERNIGTSQVEGRISPLAEMVQSSFEQVRSDVPFHSAEQRTETLGEGS